MAAGPGSRVLWFRFSSFPFWISTTVPARHPRRVASLGPGHTRATFTQIVKRPDLSLFEEKKMKGPLVFPVALALLAAFPIFAQRGGERGPNPPRANQGRVPPPPPRRDNPLSKPEPERHDAGRINSTPHVNKDHWYGHDRPDDKRYHMDHPFEHGRFEHFGPS